MVKFIESLWAIKIYVIHKRYLQARSTRTLCGVPFKVNRSLKILFFSWIKGVILASVSRAAWSIAEKGQKSQRIMKRINNMKHKDDNSMRAWIRIEHESWHLPANTLGTSKIDWYTNREKTTRYHTITDTSNHMVCWSTKRHRSMQLILRNIQAHCYWSEERKHYDD